MIPQAIPHDWHGQYPLTDLTRWRLEDKPDGIGDHHWHYVSPRAARASKQRVLEKYWIGEPYVRILFRTLLWRH
jgi:hypothetical protein